ncbi:hypothetical protein H6G33_10460 [Calothrix sp. FACHB-1219]|uniref:vWA domain-containing protein n=1 Tax=unclassified Calothrix TaxID=2619626 RepID=UPI001688BD6B|nr:MULTISPECIES: VWA-like domain-containing protein [unclassified Calothrix]MBD2201769.1 hypothetical protein [Calothrix sp. FACHB-168]MBD2217455.1 hypothetical protein [Calothrix sp. FACHB-1219]
MKNLKELADVNKEKVVEEAVIKLITRYSDLSSIILWTPRILVDKNMVASTDGKVIFIGDDFFFYEADKEQPAIILHEALHIALNHIPRFNRLVNGNMKIFNIAGDCIINGIIEGMGSICLPKDALTLDKVIKEYGVSKDISDWSTDSLYNYLINQSEANKEKLEELMGEGDLEDSEGLDRYSLDEIDPSIKDFIESSDTTRELIWQGKMAGISSTNPIFRKIRENYVVHTKWEPILRRFLLSQFTDRRIDDYLRPSKRMIALEGYSPIITPNNIREPNNKRLGIVIDTSGSIDEGILTRFSHEVDAIQKQCRVDIKLVYADDRVCASYDVPYKNGLLTKLIASNKIEPKGGGGTDFVPAIKYLLGEKIDVIVYMTDMEGYFGDFNLKKVVWAATNDSIKAPYGRTIYIW